MLSKGVYAPKLLSRVLREGHITTLESWQVRPHTDIEDIRCLGLDVLFVPFEDMDFQVLAVKQRIEDGYPLRGHTASFGTVAELLCGKRTRAKQGCVGFG